MADAIIQLPSDAGNTGKMLDESSLAVGANTVYRQRINIADPTTAAALAEVTNGAPGVADYGLFTRAFVLRPPLLGAYKFESGRLTVGASADASTGGRIWLQNPVGSGVRGWIKKMLATSLPTAASAFVTAPRFTVERFTFTGTATGAQITPAKRDSTDAANVLTVRTASTGMTITAGAVVADFSATPVLTAVGIATPVDQYLYDTTDDDDYVVLRGGEGLVIRQADAGSTSDTRLFLAFGSWEERA